ncbi:unnamed protein product [Aphis gossypii]|uniref:Uncharacterized protein n=1 Tax=Aphis gossypii TaxID=80765 RepID=A0A9P0IMZ6_APHGO|nr:unnamed protein product [Aphis gossypii]CAH1711442.1 unnamed protein product [Aphis gossypii]
MKKSTEKHESPNIKEDIIEDDHNTIDSMSGLKRKRK